MCFFYSDGSSSNTAEVKSFPVKLFEKNENKQKEAGNWQFLRTNIDNIYPPQAPEFCHKPRRAHYEASHGAL